MKVLVANTRNEKEQDKAESMVSVLFAVLSYGII
jgi:hypothetical protein